MNRAKSTRRVMSLSRMGSPTCRLQTRRDAGADARTAQWDVLVAAVERELDRVRAGVAGWAFDAHLRDDGGGKGSGVQTPGEPPGSWARCAIARAAAARGSPRAWAIAS